MKTRSFLRTGLLLALLQFAVIADAEFYSWTDDNGERRVSNVAPAGVDARGRPRRGHHPNSVAAQHHALRARLAREGRLIAAENAAASARDTDDDVTGLPGWLGNVAIPAAAEAARRR